MLPVVVFSPLFGGELASRRFRAGVVAVLSGVFTLAIAPTVSEVPGGLDYGLLLVKETLVGTALALMLIFAFQLAAAVGSLIDISRGASLAMLQDPATRQQLSTSGLFLSLLVLTLFIVGGGLGLVIGALADSFALAPPHVFRVGPASDGGVAAAFTDAFTALFALTVQLSMPVIVAVFLVDVGLALVNRAAAQVQVFFLGLTAKGWVGLAALFAAIGVTVAESVEWAERLIAASLVWLGGG